LIDSKDKLLLVGDNPFHNISHLSQERARKRTEDPSNPKFAASLIMLAQENGANGFTFSVCEKTLEILKELRIHNAIGDLQLHPVVPYAFEYVRLANQFGIPGLARKFSGELTRSKNIRSLGYGLRGVLTGDLASILKTYLSYEISRVKSSISGKRRLGSMMLHQLITDMALALDLDSLFKAYVDFLSNQKITPGFNTGNFSVLVSKFKEWNIDLRKILVATPFNKVGFQMTPSIEECEKALSAIPEPVVIGISVFAAGYINPKEAVEYIKSLPNIKGIAVGISKERHAKETFSIFKEVFSW
jgi:hypothetical protein